MNKYTITLFLLVLSAMGFWVFSNPGREEITNYPVKGTKIVALGDSLIQGIGATKQNELPSLLAKKIGLPILNMGISGNTTADGLARIDKVIEQKPDIVLLLLGGNDFLRKVPKETTFKNIDSIVSTLQQNGSLVILLGVQGGVLTDGYDEYFEEVAKTRKTLYVPNVLDGIIGRKELMSDSIHPNDLGYAKIADKIYPVLQKALE